VERRALLGCIVIFSAATLTAAALIQLAEGAAQPDKFGTIPDAIYWAVIALTTTGYGDLVPVTPLGKHAQELYKTFDASGHGGVDFSGIIQHVRSLAGK
jgi:voltage-gated potassium channel Kch